MCGVSGFFSGAAPLADGQALLDGFLQTLRHRGPDAVGSYLHKSGVVGLAHNRLSILDTRPEGNQPFWDRTHRYALILNGECYNFRAVAKQLDVSWRTRTDTEVLVEAFAAWGTDAFAQFTGMFAGAILDTAEDTLYLFRDRAGIKPLFIYQNEGFLAFASELKAFQRARLPLTVDRQAYSQFLNLLFVPGPGTVYQEVSKFPPGHWACVAAGKPYTPVPYWALEAQIAPRFHYTDEASAKRALRELLETIVGEQLVSDVPLGCFLSGGTDSTIVTALAQQLSPTPAKTFTIAFEEAGYNEAPHAARVAEHLKTDHHESSVSAEDALAYLDQIRTIYDEPFGSVSAFPTLLLCARARQHLTVALAGDGGDESFLGYGHYTWAKRLANPLVRFFAPALRAALQVSGRPQLVRVADHFRHPNGTPMRQQAFAVEQSALCSAAIGQLAPGLPEVQGLPLASASLPRRLPPVELQALQDFRYYLPDDLLVKVDRASMHSSLEVRVPLLDHRLTAFALNLPERFRKHPKYGAKYLLKQVLYDLVPRELLDRPKWGFPAPMNHWLKHELRFLLDEELSTGFIQEMGLYAPAQVEALKQRYLDGHSYLGISLWSLLLLQRWHRLFGNAEVSRPKNCA